jgi:hypothetical protein
MKVATAEDGAGWKFSPLQQRSLLWKVDQPWL